MKNDKKHREYSLLLIGSILLLVLLPDICLFLRECIVRSRYLQPPSSHLWVIDALPYLSMIIAGMGLGFWTWLSCRFSFPRLLPLLIAYPLGMILIQWIPPLLFPAAILPPRLSTSPVISGLIQSIPMLLALTLYRPLFRLFKRPIHVFVIGMAFVLLFPSAFYTILLYLASYRPTLQELMSIGSQILLNLLFVPSAAVVYALLGSLIKRRFSPPTSSAAISGGYIFRE